MGWLLTQYLWYLLAAVLLGLLVGWLVWGRAIERIRTSYESESKALRRRADEADSARQSLLSERDDATAQVARLSAAHDELSLQADAAPGLVAAHAESVAALEVEIASLQRDLEACREAGRDGQAELLDVRARLGEAEAELDGLRSSGGVDLAGQAGQVTAHGFHGAASGPDVDLDLDSADLGSADLGGADLGGADLGGVDAPDVAVDASGVGVDGGLTGPDVDLDLGDVEAPRADVAGVDVGGVDGSAVGLVGVDGSAALRGPDVDLEGGDTGAGTGGLGGAGGTAGVGVSGLSGEAVGSGDGPGQGTTDAALGLSGASVGGAVGDTDDIERIEGIGPKIGAALRAAGIDRFDTLAAASDDELRRVTEAAGLRFAPSLGTWSRQARLLADGDEEGFVALTDRLVAGRDPDAVSGDGPGSGGRDDAGQTGATGAEASETGTGGAPTSYGFAGPGGGQEPDLQEPDLQEPDLREDGKVAESRDSGRGDDIERIEGIGPKIGAALRAAGINTFEDVATTDVDRFQQILEDAGLRFAPSVGTWSRQARLLADGDEEGFIALTDRLVAGRDPDDDMGSPHGAAGDSGDDRNPDSLHDAGASTGGVQGLMGATVEADDDIERIEGIGPKIGAALRAAGFGSFERVAGATPSQLQEVLEKAELRFAPSLGTWAQQARLLADGDEEGFEALAERLVAGRKVD